MQRVIYFLNGCFNNGIMINAITLDVQTIDVWVESSIGMIINPSSSSLTNMFCDFAFGALTLFQLNIVACVFLSS